MSSGGTIEKVGGVRRRDWKERPRPCVYLSPRYVSEQQGRFGNHTRHSGPTWLTDYILTHSIMLQQIKQKHSFYDPPLGVVGLSRRAVIVHKYLKVPSSILGAEILFFIDSQALLQ